MGSDYRHEPARGRDPFSGEGRRLNFPEWAVSIVIDMKVGDIVAIDNRDGIIWGRIIFTANVGSVGIVTLNPNKNVGCVITKELAEGHGPFGNWPVRPGMEGLSFGWWSRTECYICIIRNGRKVSSND